MLSDAEKQQEYDQAPEKRILDDDQFERIQDLTDKEFATLTRDQRAAFYSTSKWHAGQRMSMDSLEGMTVGGKSVDDILREASERNEAARQANPGPVPRLIWTTADVQTACFAYLIDCALDRDENDEIMPGAKKLIAKTVALLNDPARFDQFMAELNAAELSSLDDLPALVGGRE